jgi:hypothetical protein
MSGRPDLEAIRRKLEGADPVKWEPSKAARLREIALLDWIKELEDLVNEIREDDKRELFSLSTIVPRYVSLGKRGARKIKKRLQRISETFPE